MPVITVAVEEMVHDLFVPEPREGLREVVRASRSICTEPPYVYGLVITPLNVLEGRGNILPGKHKAVDNVLRLVPEAVLAEIGVVVIRGGTAGSEITGVLGGATSIEVGEEIWWPNRVPSSTGSSQVVCGGSGD